MKKDVLRKKYKLLREDLTLADIESKSLAIANQLLKLDIWNFSFYHIFLPIEIQKEVNTEYILNILGGKDKNIVISKSNFRDFSMSHFLLTDNTTLRKNNYGIPEPDNGIEIETHKIDVIFIPLLAFDSNGNRIGYGKGFYDRFLKECNPKTIKIGLSFFTAELHNFETNSNDIALDFCVTPDKVFEF